MRRLKYLALAGYAFVALVMLIMASAFLTATEFFPYHAAASGLEWGEVELGLQTVLLAVFRICGAGWLTVAVALVLLLVFPFGRRDEVWSYFAIPLLSLIFWGITFGTTLYIARTTPATPPWAGSLVCIGITLLSALLAGLSRRSTA
jgi:uncharacterized protein involved in cysteine biosynthesis